MIKFLRDYIKDAGYIVDIAKKFWDKYTLEQIKVKIKKAQNSINNPNLLHFLCWKYKSEYLLERCNEIYPVAIYPTPESQWQSPDSILLDLKNECPTHNELNPKDATYRELLRRFVSFSLSDDRITYSMRELITDGNVSLKCELGSYFRALDTCDSLYWEILNNANELNSSNFESYQRFEKQLPLRSELHSKVENPVRTGLHRSAAIGISTLVAYNDKGSIYLWLRRRSTTGVAAYGSFLHVIPSFMFQPATAFIEDEFSVIHNIYREYLEEIFNRPELEEYEGCPEYFYGDPCLKYLTNLIQDEKAKIYLSGVGVDLLNLRPEICTVLLIQSEEWYKHHSQHSSSEERFHFNEEWETTKNYVKNFSKPIIARVLYKTKDEELMKEAHLKVCNITPPGAAAFWLGIDLLRKIL